MTVTSHCNDVMFRIAGMENIYSEHEASIKNGGAHPKLGAGNGHTDSHADKARPFALSLARP